MDLICYTIFTGGCLFRETINHINTKEAKMASIDFIKARIEGKEKEIAKLEKKLERIHKAQATNWEVNPYYYGEYDLRCTTKDLESAKAGLTKYQEQLAAEIEKANSRNIPAIVEFLDMWKARVTEYYHDQFDKYLVASASFKAFQHKYVEWSNRESWKTKRENPEEYKRITDEYNKRRDAYRAKWNFIFEYVDGDTFNDAKLAKDLQRDADAKYDFIIERTNAIVGEITDATNLYIGHKGDLNGYIIGTRGTAKVETIGAGGYNIQCYHFRTLINAMK